MITIELPWPLKELNPNHKCHWGTKSRKAALYKAWCYQVATQYRENFKHLFGHHTLAVGLNILFVPPDKRRRDDDNMESAFKHGRDGIAAALGIDDSRFRVTKRVAAAPVKHGKVIVTIEPMAGVQ